MMHCGPNQVITRMPTQNTARTSDEIIYTTVRPNIAQTNNNCLSRSMSSVASTVFSIPAELLDNLSLNSDDLESLSRNKNFRKNPIGALKKAGATKAEITALMSHPNFARDPLAALKKPSNDSYSTHGREKLESILENSASTSRSDEPFLLHHD